MKPLLLSPPSGEKGQKSEGLRIAPRKGRAAAGAGSAA